MERFTEESKATKEAIGEEVKSTGVNAAKESQPPNREPVQGVSQGDTLGDLPLTQDLKEGGEWRLVVYRRRKARQHHLQPTNGRPPIQAGSHKWRMGKAKDTVQGRFVSKEVQIAFNSAFKEGRCLRCLAKGHKRAQCRDPIRCFKCKSLGHHSGSCRQFNRVGNPIKRDQRDSARPTRFVTKHNSFVQVLTKENALPTKTNSKTEMDIEEEEPFLNERPDEAQVFTAARGELRPENEHLDRTGVIIMLQGAPTPDLPREIARTFARVHGWQSRDYEVMPSADSPFLVICPGILIRDQVVLRGVYRIRPGVVIRVLEWGVDLNMAYNPPPCEAWLRFIHLPYQAWNSPDIRKTTTVLGLITGIMPYGRAAGHFKHITLRIACEDPAEIPKHLMYHEGELSTRVRVKLLRWRFYENSPFPLHPQQQRAHGNPRNPPLNHDGPQPQQQNDDHQRQQSSGTTTLDDSVNNYSTGVNFHTPARRTQEGGSVEGIKKKAEQAGEEMVQSEVTRMTTQAHSEKETRDQNMANVANLPGDKYQVQIGDTMRVLLISPQGQSGGQISPQRSHNDMREVRGEEKDGMQGIFIDKMHFAEGEVTLDEEEFNEVAEQQDNTIKEGHIIVQTVTVGVPEEKDNDGHHALQLGCQVGSKEINGKELIEAQQRQAQNGGTFFPFSLQANKCMEGTGPWQAQSAMEAQQFGLSPPSNKTLESKLTSTEAHLDEGIAAASLLRNTPPPKKGKENSIPLRRSARAEAKGTAEKGYYRRMEGGARRPKPIEKEKLKIDFEAKRDDIAHQLAIEIVAGSGLTVTDQIRLAFEEATLKDVTEIDEDLLAMTGHTTNV